MRTHNPFISLTLSFGLLLAACSKADSPAPEEEPEVNPSIFNFSPLEGVQGTLVTLNGKNFSVEAAENTVKFNGTMAVVNTATENQLKVLVPTGASKGPISVTVAGKTATSTEDFTIKPWRQLTNFIGTKRQLAMAHAYTGKIYVGLGNGDGNATFDDILEFDPATDTWKQETIYPGSGRFGVFSFIIGSKLYIGSGNSGEGTLSKDFWSYDINTKTWAELTDLSFEPRQFSSSFVIDGKAYVYGGSNADSVSFGELWQFDPDTDTWSPMAGFENGRFAAAGFSYNNKGYVALGVNDGTSFKDLWEFDPSQGAEGIWSQKADFPGPYLVHFSNFMINDTAYIGIGYNLESNGFSKGLWSYSFATDSWAEKTAFEGSGRLWPWAIGLNGKAYMGLGRQDQTYYADIWEYDPAND
ncbi:kelch repeat-containing protein [Flagellimonas nanhaiensis]|uniref:IPT/TIG domain-containing protein n=1 Tax=Flagellimonas nanhaiensis TaxID=2292706 RepID=A0A371JSD2_9FLAO|nr:kelch repeat-containing protein [Allomuricauda nanhaiensis]RDY60722.1 hypothetical protein DX873_00635 [Allomuricauda nanhaiensis]